MTRDTRLRGTPPVSGVRKLQSSEYSATELQYFSECEDALLGDAIVADGLISQKEFAATYSALCNTYSAIGNCPNSTFQGLPTELQSLFFEAVCDGMPEPAECVRNLNSMNSMPVGYIVSAETAAEVQMHMGDLCLELLDHAFGASGVIAAPVVQPTPSPQVVDTFSLGRPAADNGSDSLPFNDSTGNAPREPVPQTESKPNNDSEKDFDLTALDSDPVPGAGQNGITQSNTNDSFTHGPIVGIAVVAGACLLLLLFVAYRKRRERRHRVKNIHHLESDHGSTSSDSDPEAPDLYPKGLVSKKVKKSLPQFDVSATAASIALKMPSDASSASRSTFGCGVSVDQIENAVDKGNWDRVYKLASLLAEQEDLSTLSSAGRRNGEGKLTTRRVERRSNLREEDQERATNLDELIWNRDWTGVAVTSALYAGESGYQKQRQSSSGKLFGRVAGKRVSNAALEASSHGKKHSALGAAEIETTSGTTDDLESPPDRNSGDMPKSSGTVPLLQLKSSMDQAVDAGDWDQVLRISSEVEKNGAFQSRYVDQQNNFLVSIPSNTSSTELPSTGGGTDAFKALIKEMDHAMSRGDWALVGYYADKIREIKITGDDSINTPTSRALVPLSRPQPIAQSRTEDSAGSIMSKKHTLEKLVQAEKWKGVSIMAGLYEMEAKNSMTSPSSESS